jgi:drug/metabolite transporter (DMT)-like permease
MLKLAKRYHIDVYQAVTWNYSMAVLLGWLFLKPNLQNLTASPVFTYSLLGLLLPALFIILANSVRLSGIVRTDIAERLSLFIPIIASFLLFGEEKTLLKFIGIGLGFAAIVLTIPWDKNDNRKTEGSNPWIYLLLVFAGFGVIDVLFKQIAAFKAVDYYTSLFIVFALAFAFSLTGLLYQVIAKTMSFSWPHIFIGWVLGIVNFANIFFYLKALRFYADKPSTVFSVMNIGVIIIGALIGLIIFKEKLSLLNKIGIAIAIIAVVVIYNI